MAKRCKRLDAFSDKRALKEAHRVKMEMKKLAREHRNSHGRSSPEWISANISKNHEHYGDTPSEHEKRKAGTLENNS